MRAGATAEEIAAAVAGIWQQRVDNYSERRTAQTNGLEAPGERRIEMSYIGG